MKKFLFILSAALLLSVTAGKAQSPDKFSASANCGMFVSQNDNPYGYRASFSVFGVTLGHWESFSRRSQGWDWGFRMAFPMHFSLLGFNDYKLTTTPFLGYAETYDSTTKDDPKTKKLCYAGAIGLSRSHLELLLYFNSALLATIGIGVTF